MCLLYYLNFGLRRKTALVHSATMLRNLRLGGFQVRPGSPLRMSSSCLMVSFRAVSSMSRPLERRVATDDDRRVRLRIRQRNGPRSFQSTGTGAALLFFCLRPSTVPAGALVRLVAVG
jgi:hypothetical protein